MSESENTNMVGNVPALAFDGGNLYVPMALHQEAIDWFSQYMGWNFENQFDNRPENNDKIIHELKTILGSLVCIQSYELREDADPLLTAVSDESRVRWCWRTKDLPGTRAYLQGAGAVVGEPYTGPGGYDYFDFWAVNKKIRLTIQEDPNLTEGSQKFVQSWNRIGVSNLSAAKSWYETFVGMWLLEDHSEKGYLLMGLRKEFSNDDSHWILEEDTGAISQERLNGTARPCCILYNKQEFAEYHAFLVQNGIIVSDILGYPAIEGFSWFHFYDQDGNRFDVYRYN